MTLVCIWTNDYVNDVSTVTSFSFLKQSFTNVFKPIGDFKYRHLLPEYLNKPVVLFVNKKFFRILFRFGGCRFAWINLMFLKTLTLFSTSVFTPDFTKSNIFELFWLEVLMKVKLLFPIVLGCYRSIWGIFNAFWIAQMRRAITNGKNF